MKSYEHLFLVVFCGPKTLKEHSQNAMCDHNELASGH